MKYQAINNYVIVRKPLEKVSESGIIIAEQKEAQSFEMEVVSVNEHNKAHDNLLGKTVYVLPRNCWELGKEGDGYYGAVKVEDILAVKA